jgi:hypothetical protein
MMQLRLKFFVTAFLGMSAMALTGCGGFSSSASAVSPGVTLRGNVHGGQQPILGATLQLYAVGSKGYGIGDSSYASGLIPTGSYYSGGRPGCVASSSQTCYANVVTDAGGSFTITGDYVCPSSPNSPTDVYLVATGGQPGGPSSPANPSIGLLAALGPCNLLTPETFIELNEITTVASVWALSPFMTGIANIGTSANNPQGLANAFATVNKLANISTGTVSGPALPAGAAVPGDKIDEIADILAACINTAGDTGPGTACDMLFTATTVNGLKPSDTITAAMNMAQHPNQGTSLSGIVVSTPPFPTKLATLADFGLVITYSGGGLSKPSGIATDLGGNVWVTNSGSDSVTKLDALGSNAIDASGFLSGATGYKMGPLSAPTALALDQSGNAWVANGNSTVTEISANGSSGTVFSGGQLNLPSGIAIDSSGNAWVTNSGGASLTKITPGTTPTYATYKGAGIASPTAIAINPN